MWYTVIDYTAIIPRKTLICGNTFSAPFCGENGDACIEQRFSAELSWLGEQFLVEKLEQIQTCIQFLNPTGQADKHMQSHIPVGSLFILGATYYQLHNNSISGVKYNKLDTLDQIQDILVSWGRKIRGVERSHPGLAQSQSGCRFISDPVQSLTSVGFRPRTGALRML